MVTRSRIRPTADEYLDQVKSMILKKYPDAEFTIVRRRNEITVDVLTDGDHTLEIVYLVADRTTDILVESGVHIVVVPLRRRRNSA